MKGIRSPFSQRTSTGAGLLGSRSGVIGIAIAAAVLAGIVLMVFLNRYRDSVSSAGRSVPVLVANQLIAKGSQGDVLAEQRLFTVTKLERRQLKGGALTDAGKLRGKVTTADIYPGEQITAAALAPAGDQLRGRLAQFQRAISVPLDEAHGMIGDVRSGDHVDVLAGFNVQRQGDPRAQPVLKTLLQNVLVLHVPGKSTTGAPTQPGATQAVTLRLTDLQAAQLAFSSDNGKVWVVLRPQAGDQQSRVPLVTLESLLFGVRPISVRATRGRRG